MSPMTQTLAAPSNFVAHVKFMYVSQKQCLSSALVREALRHTTLAWLGCLKVCSGTRLNTVVVPVCTSCTLTWLSPAQVAITLSPTSSN